MAAAAVRYEVELALRARARGGVESPLVACWSMRMSMSMRTRRSTARALLAPAAVEILGLCGRGAARRAS